MFLASLNKKEKEIFMALAIYAAEANNEIDKHEKAMMDAYCREMGILQPDAAARPSLDELLEWTAKNASPSVKRIFMLELLGIVLSDDAYDIEEREFIRKVSERIGVDQRIVAELYEQLKSYKRMVERLAQLVHGTD